MNEFKRIKSPYSLRWLWKVAVVIGFVGGGITYLLYLEGVRRGTMRLFRISLFATILLTGICIICATANWWIKR